MGTLTGMAKRWPQPLNRGGGLQRINFPFASTITVGL